MDDRIENALDPIEGGMVMLFSQINLFMMIRKKENGYHVIE
jgi:hypothetical protein